jgi:TrmH family RNA methyltransferase
VARVRFVLVRPETSANVGASARVARNTGIRGLDLVAPAGDWRTVDCWRTAWGAQDLLEEARVFPDLASALEEAALAVALTGRRPSGVPVVDVRDAAAAVAGLGRDEEAALVLGPETGGLTNAELARCGLLATIPSSPSQPSFNLSHAAAVAAYEVYRASRRRPGPEPARRATHGDKERLLGLLREGLLAIGALPPAGPEGYFQDWRSLFERAELTPKDVKLLEHMARKMVQAGEG